MCEVRSNRMFVKSRRAALCGAVLALLAGQALGGTHPRLLISPADVPRLRYACGVATDYDAANGGRPGSHVLEFQALRSHSLGRLADDPLPGEISAVAFLHLIEPADPLAAQRLALIERTLRQPGPALVSNLEMVLALDWCWADLPPDARRTFITNLAQSAGLLTAADSPLDHRVFREKLAALAAAALIDEEDESSASWGRMRGVILDAGGEYFRKTFPKFLEWRGLAPTSPTAGPNEENDVALAVEIAGLALGTDAWQEFGPRVGRCLEHYVFASFAHPALQHAFIRDDGTDAPLSPAPRWDELHPLTAHLIALRTGDSAAGFVARRVDQRLRGAAAEPLALPWQWVPIVFDLADVPRCDFSRLPLARNFGGAVVFRSAAGRSETGVWIEAGQPFLRRGQHFDAGHFLIYSGGHLTVSGGDDICLEAVPAKNGEQRLGHSPRPFEFEQYFASAIAHNCLVLQGLLRTERWYGLPYQPLAGQRLIEGTCVDFAGDLDGNPRQTARQIAYGQNADVAYLALDLLPAYESRLASAYTREFLFLDGRALLVVDRLRGAAQSDPTCVVHIPARPTLDGLELATAEQIAGDGPDAGIWRADQVAWLRWADGDGVAYMTSLLPNPRKLWIVGGPAKSMTVPQGPHAGRVYSGGDPAGFENLIQPAAKRNPQNAWFRLGQPTVLGSGFAQHAHWGRIEIAPAQKANACLFVTLFFIEADRRQAPPVSTEMDGRELRIKFADARPATVALRLDDQLGVTVTRPDGTEWKSPSSIESDASLVEE